MESQRDLAARTTDSTSCCGRGSRTAFARGHARRGEDAEREIDRRAARPGHQAEDRAPSGRSLSPRQSEVVKHLSAGLRNREIAELLGISESGVKYLIREAARKTQKNRVGLATWFAAAGQSADPPGLSSSLEPDDAPTRAQRHFRAELAAVRQRVRQDRSTRHVATDPRGAGIIARVFSAEIGVSLQGRLLICALWENADENGRVCGAEAVTRTKIASWFRDQISVRTVERWMAELRRAGVVTVTYPPFRQGMFITITLSRELERPAATPGDLRTLPKVAQISAAVIPSQNERQSSLPRSERTGPRLSGRPTAPPGEGIHAVDPLLRRIAEPTRPA